MNIAYSFMAKNLKKNKENITSINYICALCGKKINEGKEYKKVLSTNFMDWQRIRYNSEYFCIDCCSLFDSKAFNGKAIRNYHLLFTENKIEIVKEKNDIQNIILNFKKPFIFQYTFSYKKHAFYDAKINYSKNIISITTDKGNIDINKKDFIIKFKTIKELLKGKFSRSEISIGESMKFNKIESFGINKYYKKMTDLDDIRNTLYLEFLLKIV
jgi:CRISPR type IV-associated protein Csf1